MRELVGVRIQYTREVVVLKGPVKRLYLYLYHYSLRNILKNAVLVYFAAEA
jgi:hypothetical protein